MLGSGILDFAIGLVFTFLAMSLAAGAATEALSSFLKIRSAKLLKGVQDLFNDPNLTGLAGELYQHALINPRHDGTVPSWWDKYRKSPAYIDPDQFAAAFLDIVKGLPTTSPVTQPPAPAQPDPVTTLKAAVDAKMPPAGDNQPNPASDSVGRNDQMRNMLHGMIDRAKGDEEKIRQELSTWFDTAMDRVSGVYKRWTQLWTFIFAFLMAAILNVSTINVAETLWRQPIDTKAMEAFKDDNDALKNALDILNKLPIGWPPNAVPGVNKLAVSKQGNSGSPASAKPGAAASPTGAGAGEAATPTNPTAGVTPPKLGSDSGNTGANVEDPEAQFHNVLQFLHRAPNEWDWTRIAGWLITAFATLFGAPFWFDALQQIVRLKGAGPSPADKKPAGAPSVAAAAAAGAAAGATAAKT
jgi:hypothetical protein